ncbi:MAG: glucosaminidase domain-containing protein, partial [Flammeovirgaceae bacterium]|nr:glucosaminidase domain-containing protein [Flammeovirgaceae bacterium]MDW8288642.1 glucosaminidase domain-containing protein [Flammeovirgaceae bacterium]
FDNTEDVMEIVWQEEKKFLPIDAKLQQKYREEFLYKKQRLISTFLIENKVSRVDQLKDSQLLALNKGIYELFVEIILKRINPPKHVYEYFTSEWPLRKIETSLMEQAKFNIPSSIKLAQSALETGYGKRVIRNNYFGIKDKTKKSKLTETIEYYTEEELKANESIIIHKTKVHKNGRTLYRCKVRDHFEEYESAWASFREHSKFLSENHRYAPLFTKGKDYEAWADKIGSTKYGGVGYATSPLYGEMLKGIIRRYHLDLLDH